MPDTSSLPDDLSNAATSPPRARMSLAPAFGARLGLAVVGVGLIVIGLGWNGASGRGGFVNGATDVRGQIPWLLSGGFLGIGIVLLGCTITIVQALRADRARLEDLLQHELGRMVAALAAAPTAASTSTASTEGLVVTGAASYHSITCRLAGDEGQLVTVANAKDQGLRACRVCKPA